MNKAETKSLDSQLARQENRRMKTTLDLPDGLVRAIELRAVQEGRKVTEVVADLLAASMVPPLNTSPGDGQPVSKDLPLIKIRPAPPADARKLTTQEWCDWLKDLDLQIEW